MGRPFCFPNFTYHHYSLVWCLFEIIPLLCYSSSDKAFNMSDCGEYGASNSSDCNSLIWEFQSNVSVTPEAYIGSACSSYLLNWQKCALGLTDSGIIVINANVDQAENEQLAIDTLDVIG